MSGRKNFRILREQLEARLESDPEARAEMDVGRQALRDALALAALREERGLTQADVAHALHVTQANVSQVEHKEDLYLSTLSKYVQALGGRLELKAVFADRVIDLVMPGTAA
jgi:DNA-binding XRE family transcriptional regulator